MKQSLFWLTFLLCVLLLTASVSGAVEVAAQADKPLHTRFRILDKNAMTASEEGELILLFSDATIDADYHGDIYVLFSAVTLTGPFDGHIYTLSSAVTYPNDTKPHIEPLFGPLSFFADTSVTDDLAMRDDRIPLSIILLLWVAAETLICMILFPLKPGFMEQGAMLLFAEPTNVLRNGLTSFFFLLALIFIFGLTVFLSPVAVILFLVMQVLIWLGEVSLAITIGWLISTQLLKRPYTPHYMVGTLLGIGLIKCIPYVSVPFTYLFVPLLSLGLVTTCLINGWIRRKYYETPFHTNFQKKVDFSIIRGMIMDDIDM